MSRTDEVSDLKRMTTEEVTDYLDPAYACRLLDAFDIGTVAVRTQDGIELINRESE